MNEQLTPYQRRLFVFLSVATFFEGYDFIALAQILPNLRADLHLSRTAGGLLVTVINLGTVFAYALVRYADRIGRRRLLSLTIAGYTLFTFLSGVAPNVYVFAAFQLLARIFLIGEWIVSMVYAAEEFPAARRGMVIGVIQGCSSLGSIVCAGVAPLLLHTAYGWRSVYFVGVVPLVLLAVARRGLRESERFAKLGAHLIRPGGMLALLRSPHGRRIVVVGMAWFFTYACTQVAITFWKEFALADRHFTDAQVGLSISIAALASMPMVFLAGRMLDVIGRRRGAVVIYVVGAAGIACSYTLHGFIPLTIALVFGIFGSSAVLAVLNAFSTELFPTQLRADAFSLANNLIGRVSYVIAPLAVAAAAQEVGWGPAVGGTSASLLVALGIIVTALPETRARELEDTSRVGS